jgi:hypothetical protein
VALQFLTVRKFIATALVAEETDKTLFKCLQTLGDVFLMLSILIDAVADLTAELLLLVEMTQNSIEFDFGLRETLLAAGAIAAVVCVYAGLTENLLAAFGTCVLALDGFSSHHFAHTTLEILIQLCTRAGIVLWIGLFLAHRC